MEGRFRFSEQGYVNRSVFLGELLRAVPNDFLPETLRFFCFSKKLFRIICKKNLTRHMGYDMIS